MLCHREAEGEEEEDSEEGGQCTLKGHTEATDFGPVSQKRSDKVFGTGG